MTPEQQKTAEFAVEYLGGFFDDEISRWVLPKGIWNFIGRTLHQKDLAYLFFGGQYAPILMHLGQEKAEREGFCMQSITLKKLDEIDRDGNITKKGYLYKFDFALDNRPWMADYSENKFYAFWRALELAAGGGK